MDLLEAWENPLLPESAKRLASMVNEQDLEELVGKLIPAGQPNCSNSMDPEAPEPNERPVAEAVVAYLEDMGIHAEIIESRPGRANVVGSWTEGVPGPRLLLNDHLDTYPVLDSERWTFNDGNPYMVARDGDLLYGRGTSDTRGNLASQLLAVRLLRNAGFRPAGELILAYTCDEERNGTYGASYLLEQGLDADLAIVSEPTAWTEGADWGLGIATAHSGHMLLDVKLTGDRSHVWRPDQITNVISRLSGVLTTLEQTQFRHKQSGRPAPLPPCVCPVSVHAGERFESHFTPSHCTIRIAVVGILPGMNKHQVAEDVEVAMNRAGLSEYTQVKPLSGPSFVAPTDEVPDSSGLVSTLSGAYEALAGKSPVRYRKNAYCDTIRFSHAGIPTVTFGPGEDGWAPTNEYISLKKSVFGTQVLIIALAAFLNGASRGG